MNPIQPMNCWRTTWGATLHNVGTLLGGFTIMDATGISPIMSAMDKRTLGWLFIVALVLKGVGTQWMGMAAADQLEVKRQLGLKADGFPLDYESGATTHDRARLGLGVAEQKAEDGKPKQ